jgi:hypothetical protein
MRLTLFLAACSIAATAPAIQAQSGMPESYREYQSRMLASQRRLLLAMADSMPERLYRDHATPIQRDFAEQVNHAASSIPLIARMTMNGGALNLPDTATALNTRAGLKSIINASFDYAANLLRTQSAASRNESVDLFGQTMPRWQVWDELSTHTMWTAGQIVANFRKNGMAPPAFGFF